MSGYLRRDACSWRAVEVRILVSLICAVGVFGACYPACAASPSPTSTIVSAGTDVAIAMPVIAGGISLYKDDETGIAEMGLDTLLTVGTAYGLSHVVREKRPDHSDDRSFPSETEALAFAPAAFLWDRYGWSYGVPAYAAAAFVGYARVDGLKHHWWDVAASGAIGWTYSEIFTTRYRLNDRFSTSAYATPQGGMVSMIYRW